MDLERRREAVFEILAHAFSEDRLDAEEYENRVSTAAEARDHSDLDAVVEDLAPPVPASHPRAVAATARDEASVTNIIGDRNITLADAGSGGLRIFSLIGDVDIDVTDLAPGAELQIMVKAAIGDATIRVPRGARLRRNLVTLIGDTKVDLRAPESDSGPLIRISGFRFIGDLTIVDGFPS